MKPRLGACAFSLIVAIWPGAGWGQEDAHRAFGLGVELAYNQSFTGFPYTGYGFVPIAQGGPDQLYQLQAINDFQDSLTTSALLLFYPVALVTQKRLCVSKRFRILCTDGLFALGFGPTFLRGGSGEFGKQWNLRAGFELLPYVLLLAGPSWRTMDISSNPASLGAIVSVPRPASPPSFEALPRADVQWSVGIALDLAVLSTLASAVARVVTRPSAGAHP